MQRFRGTPISDSSALRERGADQRAIARIGAHAPTIEQPEPRRFAAKEDRPRDIEVLREIQLLVDERDARLGRIAHAVEQHRLQSTGIVRHVQRTLARLHDARQDLEQRRLAGPVLADDGEHLATAHVGVDARERRDARVSAADATYAQEDGAIGMHGRAVTSRPCRP
jgi:hypothetical protein